MNTLVLLFIVWVVSKILFDKAKERLPNPTLPQQEEEFPTYRLPPDLRGKWGPKDEEVHTIPNVEDIVLAEPPTVPQQYKIAGGTPVLESSQQAKAPKLTVLNPNFTVGTQENPHSRQELFEGRELSPGMLRQGIILSEILGPPVARRRSGRTYH